MRAALLSLVILMIVCYVERDTLEDWMLEYVHWAQIAPYKGFFVFSAIMFAILFVSGPGFIVYLSSGYTYAKVTGSTAKATLIGASCCFLGAYIGSKFVFMLSRYLLRT